MTVAFGLLAAHAAAAVFGLAGMLVALRRPDLWVGSGVGEWLLAAGMRYGGAVQIALGAAAVLAFGGVTIGWRRTALFFASATAVSLGMELVGTTTGWPFGPYAYGETLGPKVLGRVPYAIPLSWFSVGLVSYLLAVAAVGHGRHGVAVGLAVWWLVVWDLVLDPAMSHAALPVRFWSWEESGLLGMPVRNLAGWALTGASFIVLARALWRDDVEASCIPVGFPLAVYALQLGFAIVLAASAGLWLPILLALALAPLPWLAVRAAAPR